MSGTLTALLLLNSSESYSAQIFEDEHFGGYHLITGERQKTPREFWPDQAVVVGEPVLGRVLQKHSVAAVFRSGEVTILPFLPGKEESRALAINRQGTIVGDSPSYYGRPTIWSVEGVKDLGSLPGHLYGYATDINDSGVIVGVSRSKDGSSTPVIFHKDGPKPLPLPEGVHHGLAEAVNNRNMIVGYYSSKEGKIACAWIDEKLVNLGKLPGQNYSQASDINSRGEVVGHSGPTIPFLGDGPVAKEHFESHVFLLKEGQMIDLTQIAMRVSPSLFIFAAKEITDKGEIIGEGKLKGKFVWYVLTPK